MTLLWWLTHQCWAFFQCPTASLRSSSGTIQQDADACIRFPINSRTARLFLSSRIIINHADKGDLNNYRDITIASIVSKIFEHAKRIVFKPFLSTSSYQFGFKKASTSLAIQSLKESINYYKSNGSNAYCSFLDDSKAFDQLVHTGVFTKLIQRHTPLIFINIIIKWYSDLQCRVRWARHLVIGLP